MIIATAFLCVETILMNMNISTEIQECWEHRFERVGDSTFLEEQWISSYKSMETLA